MTETEIMIYDSKGSYPKVTPSIYTHNRQILKAEAEFAKAMIQTGMMLGRHEKHGDKETVKFSTPAEIVTRACALAELAYAEFATRGWIVPLPSIDEMREEIKGHTEANGSVGFHAREQTGQNGKAHQQGER
jgi:hypothetical protein